MPRLEEIADLLHSFNVQHLVLAMVAAALSAQLLAWRCFKKSYSINLADVLASAVHPFIGLVTWAMILLISEYRLHVTLAFLSKHHNLQTPETFVSLL